LFAIVSDIHANLEAFSVVLEDIRSKGIETVYCLGDIVGYGPNPIECTRLVVKNCKFSIVGNHDYALIEGSTYGFNSKASNAIVFTRRVMMPGFFSFLNDKKKLWAYLKNMKNTQKVDNFYFVHGSPLDPIFEYVQHEDTEHLGFGYTKDFEKMFQEFEHICFNGHTHKPLVIVQENNEYKSYIPENMNNEYQIKPGVKAMINAGSVGQPRDNNPNACYITVDDKNLVKYIRLKYDVEATAKKIYNNPDLHDWLGERLAKGE